VSAGTNFQRRSSCAAAKRLIGFWYLTNVFATILLVFGRGSRPCKNEICRWSAQGFMSGRETFLEGANMKRSDCILNLRGLLLRLRPFDCRGSENIRRRICARPSMCPHDGGQGCVGLGWAKLTVIQRSSSPPVMRYRRETTRWRRPRRALDRLGGFDPILPR